MLCHQYIITGTKSVLHNDRCFCYNVFLSFCETADILNEILLFRKENAWYNRIKIKVILNQEKRFRERNLCSENSGSKKFLFLKKALRAWGVEWENGSFGANGTTSAVYSNLAAV